MITKISRVVKREPKTITNYVGDKYQLDIFECEDNYWGHIYKQPYDVDSKVTFSSLAELQQIFELIREVVDQPIEFSVASPEDAPPDTSREKTVEGAVTYPDKDTSRADVSPDL